mgnify:CR=1 FL=1|tara:strand:- start:2569 stop:2793 length:225 start_codon:yes stop_codon:yes gene_type:complete
MESFKYERSSPIPLKKVSSFESCKELSLNHNIIDPTKMSPPNFFLDKLKKRIDTYYSPNSKKERKFSFDFNVNK